MLRWQVQGGLVPRTPYSLSLLSSWTPCTADLVVVFCEIFAQTRHLLGINDAQSLKNHSVRLACNVRTSSDCYFERWVLRAYLGKPYTEQQQQRRFLSFADPTDDVFDVRARTLKEAKPPHTGSNQDTFIPPRVPILSR